MIRMGSIQPTKSDYAAISSVLDSNQLSPGPKVKEFEDRFALRHGCDFGVMVNSGTDALRIALATLKEVHKWNDGDYVIVPAVTFVATINVILQLNLKPYVVDVSSGDFMINVDRVRHFVRNTHIASKIRAIIPVHFAGQPCDMAQVMSVAKEFNLKVIEDSCETMGVNFDGKPVGSWGDIGCFSFYVAHLLTTGVGGMAVTNSPKYAEIMRSYANHGRDPYYLPGTTLPPLSIDLLKRRFSFQRIGYSCRATEFEAALGLEQLKGLDKIISKRQLIAEQLIRRLQRLPLILPRCGYKRDHSYMFFPILIDYEVKGWKDVRVKYDKWKLCLHLEKAEIETRDLMPILNQPCYQGLLSGDTCFESAGCASIINKCGFYIPCHQSMTQDDINHIVHTFESFFTKP